ncbi:MAG TPA: MmgE/PrpD family protein [Methylomirabilota bacterium]|nr:MmgE/PrpD family protein [Methylomirabilota bacterium]
MGDVSTARRLARFVLGLDLASVPASVVERARRLTLDILGCALAASSMDFARAALATARGLGGPAESTLIGGGARVGAANAVLANATLAHGLDFDDTREDAIVHTGCVAVPVALALAQATAASGAAVLTALVAAVEVMCRVGLAVPGRLHARHFHPTAVTGVFGAAAAAGRLYRLDEDRLVNAFGICGSQASGIIEYLTDGTWTKRLHPGWAAHAGVVAALLARDGFTGPEHVLEGRHGFYAAFADGHNEVTLEALLGTLGREWEIERLTFKPFPCGSIAQPYMDCALRLRSEHAIAPDDVVEIRCRTAAGPVPRLWEPLAAKHRPPNGYAAKFSLPYLIAVILIRGRASLAEFTDEAVRDEAVLRLAGRVSYDLDETIDYPRQFIGQVSVRLRDGRVLDARQNHPRGGADHPLTAAELEAKFRGNAGLVLPAARIDRIIAEVGGLGQALPLDDLMEALQ